MADAFTINEDTALVIAAGSLTANDTDIDGGALSVTSVQGALNGTVTLAGRHHHLHPDGQLLRTGRLHLHRD